MTFVEAIILGIVEGLTEFLPISSTGHLIITSTLLSLPRDIHLAHFEVAIQVGAIIAVMARYVRAVISFPRLMYLSGIGFLPAAIAGLLFYDKIAKFLIEGVFVVMIALVLGGVIMIFIDSYIPHKEAKGVKWIAQQSPKEALIIGASQIFAFIPGVSRAAATIITARLQGYSPSDAAEFSFLLAIPTIVAASALSIYKNYSLGSSFIDVYFIVGACAAFISAWLVLGFFINIIGKWGLTFFGWYRIVLALVLAFWFFL